MINVSNAFKQGLENGERVWIEVDIAFSDGTSKHLKNEIMSGNNSFSDCAESSSFPVGCVICKSMTLELDNTSDQWKDYYFYMAKVHAYLKMQIDADTVETIDKGVYTITTPEQYGEILSFTALDDMYKTNAAFSTKLVLPQTVESLVRDACETLGITVGFSEMVHGDLIINELPKDMTYRQLFGWAAMLDTANARLDSNGSLQFVGWNLETAPSIELKDYISTPAVSSDDIVITGINIINGENSETYGTSGYILSMENNLVGESDLATVAAQIGDSIIGAKFRNLQGDMVFNPLLEFGDVVYTYDRNLNQYVTPLTDVSYTINGKTTVKTQADDPIRGMSLYYSGATKAIVAARQLVEKEKTARELAIKNLQESLSVGSGLFATYVKQEDESTISYFHDKASLEESKNVIKITSEAIGVSNDGGKTYPFGFQLTGTLITKLLYAEGINANYIDTGALTIKDEKGNIIFKVDMDTNTVYMNPDILIIGKQTLTEKLTAMDNSIAESKNVTMQLTNDYQSITTDSDGNIPGTFPTVTTTAQVMYGNDNITGNCIYNISKSSNVTGSWNSSTYTYTVTGLSADDGWVDIKATYLQTLSITRRFTIAKLKAGKNGLEGLQGEKGEQGIPGPKGEDGKTSHFHIKYSSVASPTSSSQMTETPSTYIGTYVDFEETDSTDPSKYTWARFEGIQGPKGEQGIPGVGTDGKTSYLHIAYANSADGKTGFSVSDGTNKLYIGQYTDTTKEDSTDPTKYTWSKIKGEQGADGKPGRTYIIEPSCNVLKRGADKNISPNFLEFNAYYRDGDSATRYAYKGRFVIEETADGNTWTTIYRSSTDESTVKHYLYTILTDGSGQTITDGNGTTVGIPRDITNIRCKLYASGGTTTLMDMQSVAVAVDVASLTQEQIFNILTNGGEAKGIYKEGNQLYISFTYAKGGELVLGGVSNGYGILKVLDMYDDGAVSVIADSSGITCTDSFSQKGNDFIEYAGVRFSKRGLKYVKAGVDITGDVHIEGGDFEGDGYPYEPYDDVVVNWLSISQDANGDYTCDGYFDFLTCESGILQPISITVADTFSASAESGVKPEFKKEVLFRQGLRVYNYPTVTSGHNCYINQNTYQLSRYSSSSKRYKNIGDELSEEFISNLYNITPVMAQYKDGYLDKDDERVGEYFPMFIAEDVEKYFPLAVDHVDGLAENWNERIMVPAMFAMLKSQKSEIDTLKQELDKIKQLLRKE
nr:MAG TPA: tail protein [Caudoviricetes sp.]